MTSLYDLPFDALRSVLTEAGLAQIHARSLWRALHREADVHLLDRGDLSPPLKRWIAQNVGSVWSADLPEVVREIHSTDGQTRKLLLRLQDGAQVETVVNQWGLHVELIGLQDVQLPPQMQEVLAKAAIAERDRTYVIIKSEADVASAKNFAEAAGILANSPGAMELRRFEALANLSQTGATKVIFDLAKPFEDLSGRKTAAAMAEAGVGDDDVEPSEAVDSLLRGGDHGGAVADIGADGEAFAPGGGNLLDERGEAGRVAGGGDDAKAALGKGDRGGMADSAGCAGDEDDLIFAHGIPSEIAILCILPNGADCAQRWIPVA